MASTAKVGVVAPNGPGEIVPPAKVVEGNRPYRSDAALWHGPGANRHERRIFSWHTLVWSLVFPPKRHRISLTVPGFFLMLLAMGIGTAAYNTASNILFISLSLLLACLLLSGLLSWFNFAGICWRLRPQGPWRAAHETMVTVELQNRKSWLPTYSLWFELAMQPRKLPAAEKPDKQMSLREILAATEKFVTRGRLFMRQRIEPGGEAKFDWVVKPTRRGETLVELAAVGSLFPFGFLKKSLGVAVRQTVLVWPAQVAYQWEGAAAARSGSQGQRSARAGTGDDLLALRKYAQGDSHRLIHWKASARLGQMMVRQFAAESHDGYVLELDTPADRWPGAGQFELLCSFAGTLAEDLYAAGRLRGVSINGAPLIETRRLRDVEAFLDALATIQPAASGGGGTARRAGARRGGGNPPPAFPFNVIRFAPDGAQGVAAFTDGRKTASA